MLSISKADTLVLVGIVLITWYLHRYIQARKENPNSLPLPPGPKGYPIIGSFFMFPRYKPWLEYDRWSKIYGDMIYFKVFGYGFLILGTLERSFDIFERRSSNYSDRPRLVMINEMMGSDYMFSLLPYGAGWRQRRRSFHDHFHPNVIHMYHPIHLESSRTFIRRLLGSPEKFRYHIRYAFADVILKAVYGVDVQQNESYVEHVETLLSAISLAGNVGAFLVDIFPIMKMIPEWFPGAGWKRKASLWRSINSIIVNSLWDSVKEQVNAGTAQPCVAAAMIQDMSDDGSPESKEEELVQRDTCAVGFAGKSLSYSSVLAGSDTTVSTVSSFFMAMALYPEVQKKAQAELDHVLDGRLPEFNDRPNLPYINAMLKESARWQPVAPLAITHMNSDADEYNGYYIPKGTYVIGNAWSILHDPKVYKDPFVYNPERFLKDGELDPSVQDPTLASFGFGRRACPGRYFSDASLFCIVAHVLTVFDIKPSLDENGNEIEIIPNMTDGLLSYPEAFECRITPRSSEAEQLIQNTSLMT